MSPGARAIAPITVRRQSACAACDLPSQPRLRRWVAAALDGRAPPADITVRVVDETESRSLNRDYRGVDRPTNVLSFGYDPPPGGPTLVGDLVICAAVVAREAAAQGKAAEAHWAHLVVHGTLHLLGYDHQNEDDARVMETLEAQILAKLGIPDPYAVA